jgi:hypothetical protein
VGRACGIYVEERKVYKVSVGTPEGKRPLERPRRRWEDGIERDLRKAGWEGVEWIHLTQDRDRWQVLVNTLTNTQFLVPWS